MPTQPRKKSLWIPFKLSVHVRQNLPPNPIPKNLDLASNLTLNPWNLSLPSYRTPNPKNPQTPEKFLRMFKTLSLMSLLLQPQFQILGAVSFHRKHLDSPSYLLLPTSKKRKKLVKLTSCLLKKISALKVPFKLCYNNVSHLIDLHLSHTHIRTHIYIYICLFLLLFFIVLINKHISFSFFPSHFLSFFIFF